MCINTMYMYIAFKKTRPCNIQRFFSPIKIENYIRKTFDIFLTFAQNIDLCFGAKIRKIGIPLQTPVLLHVYKRGLMGYILHVTDMFS